MSDEWIPASQVLDQIRIEQGLELQARLEAAEVVAAHIKVLEQRVSTLTEALESIRSICMARDEPVLRHIQTLANLALNAGRS